MRSVQKASSYIIQEIEACMAAFFPDNPCMLSIISMQWPKKGVRVTFSIWYLLWSGWICYFLLLLVCPSLKPPAPLVQSAMGWEKTEKRRNHFQEYLPSLKFYCFHTLASSVLITLLFSFTISALQIKKMS